MANSADPNQMPPFAIFGSITGLSLLCMSMYPICNYPVFGSVLVHDYTVFRPLPSRPVIMLYLSLHLASDYVYLSLYWFMIMIMGLPGPL